MSNKVVAEECVKITAEILQFEFEDYFKDCLPEAYLKMEAVTSALGEDNLNSVLLQDNRLYLYEILLDNEVCDIVDDISNLIKTSKK